MSHAHGHMRDVFAPRRAFRGVARCALGLALLGLPAPAAGAVFPVAEPALASSGVNVEQRVRAHMEFLASDELGGRETATVEGLITARYVASVFRSIGLQPGGDEGGFLQRYELEMTQLSPAETTLGGRGGVASAGAEETLFELGSDWVLRGYNKAGIDYRGDVVFVGHGVVDAEAGVDDYAGIDVTGRFLLALAGNREGAPRHLSARKRRVLAQERGATGMLFVMEDEDESPTARIFGYLARELERRTMALATPDPEPGFPFVMLKNDPAGRLLSGAGEDLESLRRSATDGTGSARTLPGLELSLSAVVTTETVHAFNVAGVLPGSDPELADEYVIMSAHMDHIGIDSEGNVNNGADDNASGTTTVMTTAELLAGGVAPRRSILFLAVSGEEKGLLGSKYWVDHPTVPLENVVGNVNIDMVGRNEPELIGATPSPEHEHYNELVERSVALAPEFGFEVTWNAGSPDRRRRVDEYYSRSDHYNFADKGIPVVFFFSGEHEDYHRPSDTLEKIDIGKLGRMSRFSQRLITEVADEPSRPARLAP